ncbi:SDR family NAD(P)-dependent oxidoreductase [Nonomuraea sp. NPDC050540]|uniref:SDR family NAD(P)-dependent oxidoreductase n=1 Tax=Nonomuraea sp. NPDC050540 TaxID=3364367 RepID=UPI0037961BD5
MHGKTVLITGSTAGIGKETARALVARGAHVILVGRDPGRAEAAATELARGAGRAEAMTADVFDLRGLRELAARVRERGGRLDALVNNAGANTGRRRLTADGVETMFAAHVLTPYTLTWELLPLLRGGGRVVNVTGGIPGAPIELDNLQAEKRFLGWTFSQYNHTKTMLMAMSHRMAERLREHDVAVNVVYPGHGDTPMNRRTAMSAFPYVYRPLAPLVRLIAPLAFGDLAKPARSSVHLAASAEVDGVSGAYFGQNLRRRPWPRTVLDERVRDAVWDLCEKLSA